MKKIILLPTMFLLIFCNSNKEIVKKEEVNKTINNTVSVCPTDGFCTIELLKNKSLVVKTDELGSIYTQITESKTTSVIVFQYNKNVKGDLQDAGYREEIIFEINNDYNELTLENSNLQQTKMLFGRFCFCREQTGYYKIEEGKLLLKKNGNNTTLNLNFTCNQVPQIINKIATSIN